MPRLRAAVWSKNVNVVSRLLIEPGIYVGATDYLDSTALHHACYKGRKYAVIEIFKQTLGNVQFY